MIIQNKQQLQDLLVTKVLQVLDLPKGSVEMSTDLIEVGMNSLKTVELIVLIEEELEIQIDDDDLILDNFRSLEMVCKLLLNKFDILPIS
ncbi:acyl carrier protein [Brevibacillus sp. SAFN-007a]|uniref:acyl carrier protein n=1 Tax=Brevibacillus sp. SAFN-007a TaxID=3436862 RepID=UPI003F80F932